MGRVKRRTTKERMVEVYEHLHRYHGVHTKQEMAAKINRDKSSIYLATSGDERYLTGGMVDAICGAYPNVFNKDYLLQGIGNLLTNEEVVRCERVNGSGSELVSMSAPITPNAASIISTLETALKNSASEHAKHIKTLEEMVADRDQTILNLQHQVSTLQYEIDELKNQQKFTGYPFTSGVAEQKQK